MIVVIDDNYSHSVIIPFIDNTLVINSPVIIDIRFDGEDNYLQFDIFHNNSSYCVEITDYDIFVNTIQWYVVYR